MEARKMFYSAYILPHFDYCSVVWSNATMNKLQDLIKLQKRAARLILDKRYDTASSVLFEKLNWLPLLDRLKYNECIQVYKALNDDSPLYMSELFTKNSTNLRSSTMDKLFVPRNCKKSFSFTGAINWNNLPAELRSLKSLTQFKENLKKHLMSQHS